MTSTGEVDYTKVPSTLDSNMEAVDTEKALRPTTIKPGDQWTLKSAKSLLSASGPGAAAHGDNRTTSTLDKDRQTKEKHRALDLLDALSRSGELPLADCELHVIVAATHCFDDSLMDTVVQKNVNPIERVERSLLVMAGTIHGGMPVPRMLKAAETARVKAASPMLFLESGSSDE